VRLWFRAERGRVLADPIRFDGGLDLAEECGAGRLSARNGNGGRSDGSAPHPERGDHGGPTPRDRRIGAQPSEARKCGGAGHAARTPTKTRRRDSGIPDACAAGLHVMSPRAAREGARGRRHCARSPGYHPRIAERSWCRNPDGQNGLVRAKQKIRKRRHPLRVPARHTCRRKDPSRVGRGVYAVHRGLRGTAGVTWCGTNLLRGSHRLAGTLAT